MLTAVFQRPRCLVHYSAFADRQVCRSVMSIELTMDISLDTNAVPSLPVTVNHSRVLASWSDHLHVHVHVAELEIR